MKILIIRTTPNKVSLKTYNLQEIGLAKALIRKGHQCDVMYFTDEKDRAEKVIFDNEKYSFNILWLHGYGAFYEGIYPSLKNYVDCYDIIQVGGYVGITSCWLNRKYQQKVINFQGPYYYANNKGDKKKAKIWDHILLPLSNKDNMIVATKSTLASDYIKSKGIKDVTTIGVGLDLSNLKGTDDACNHEFVQQLFSQKENYRYLLYIGSIEDRRNIIFMLEVFSSVHNAINNTRLVIIGKGKSDYVKHCKDKIKALGIENFVIWRESLEQKYLKPVYEISDAFLLPTKYEIFGMVLLEAMYFGLPVFTTYNGGSSTLMDESNGIVINVFDVDIWTKKICEILNNDQERKMIGQCAHRTIKEYYTWDKLANKFLEVYKKRLK